MCKECVDASEFTLDEKPLCRDCNLEVAKNQLANAENERGKNLIKVILLGVTVAIGLPMFIYGWTKGDTNMAIYGLLIMCIGGVPTAWRATKRSAKEKAEDAVEDWKADQEGIGGSIINMLIRGLLRIVLVVVIGSVAAPILLIISIVRFVKGKSEIENCQAVVDSFGANNAVVQ